MVVARALMILAVLLALGCSDGADRTTTATPSPATTEVPRPITTAEATENGVLITKAEYGADWPYTVDSGLLHCDPPGSNVVLKAEGKVYALNGRAMGNATERGYLNARDTITLRDDNGYFTIGNVGKIIDRGLAMCN